MSQNATHWCRAIAMYAASLFRLGNFVDAGFAASVLFETYIEQELARCGMRKSEDGSFMVEAIDTLAAYDSRRYSRKTLSALRKIRNKSIIHSDDVYENFLTSAKLQPVQADIKKLVSFVWQQFDPERYDKYRQIEAIPHLEADFAILAVREFFQNNRPEEAELQGTQIRPEDFNDLMHMRKHFLHLARHLNAGLLKQYPNLEIDQISHTDTSSGYVWLAVNHKRPHADHSRDRIRHSSASIFATPLDLRISIDFGGEASMGRDDYYTFLASEEAQSFIDTHTEFMFIDLEWYSFVTSAKPATELIKSKDFSSKLKQAMEQLSKTKKAKQIITWERLLLGFVHPRGEISFSIIEEQLNQIIELYYCFERFRRDQLKRKNGLNWVPEGI